MAHPLARTPCWGRETSAGQILGTAHVEGQGQARRATTFLGRSREIVLTDVILAEVVYVLETFYRRPRSEVATAARSLLALRSISVGDIDLLLGAISSYENQRLDFAEAYLAAAAERWGIGAVASFDRDLNTRPFPR